MPSPWCARGPSPPMSADRWIVLSFPASGIWTRLIRACFKIMYGAARNTWA
jgi:hypothetical protein